MAHLFFYFKVALKFQISRHFFYAFKFKLPASLTNTVLSIQSHVELAGNFDSAVVQIMSNISAVKSELTFVNKDISTLKPEVMVSWTIFIINF